MRKIEFGKWHIQLPAKRSARIALGVLLLIGGLLGFLPVLGFWMIPLGLLVLSVDLPKVRQWRRQLTVWWYNNAARKKTKSKENSTRH